MHKFQHLQHTKEEIDRCNIEIQWLHTSIVDEHHEFDEIMKKMEKSPDPWNIEAHEFIDQQHAVNRMLLAQILDIYALQGFTGDPTPGVSKSLSWPLEVTPEPVTCGDDNGSDSNSNDDLSDALLADLGGLDLAPAPGLQPPQTHLHDRSGPGLLPNQQPWQPLAITTYHRHQPPPPPASLQPLPSTTATSALALAIPNTSPTAAATSALAPATPNALPSLQQKARWKQEHMEAKVTYKQALQEAQDQVQMLAKSLHAQFQKHFIEHYYEKIMQTLHMQKNHKKAGSWNAFVSMKTQRMIAGE
ncbi:hypothetical protein C0993_001461 [Termitomyces sp. T159_Od127]|nr:hypothetical protein C0993_001461 [Termitomyces sp. T159_Od127]